MAKTVFETVTEELDSQLQSKIDFLVSGRPEDYAQYREVVGTIRGLRACRQYVEDLSRNYMEDDDYE